MTVEDNMSYSFIFFVKKIITVDMHFEIGNMVTPKWVVTQDVLV